MADNVPFQTTVATPASGTSVASKEVTFSGDTTKVQLVELVGVTGSEGARTLNEISNASGVIVQDGGNSLTVDGTVAVSGTVTVGSHAVTNAGTFVVQENGTALTRLTDIETNTDALAVVGNGAAATAQRVTLANDSTGTVTASQAGTWNITNVSGTVSLPTGASTAARQDTANTALAAIQTAVEILDNTVSGSELQVDVLTLPALPAGTNNIGDMDILSIAAGDNNIGNVDIVSVPAPLSTTGGGTEATALRVTLATDSTGVVSVDDNGASLTVDGTVAISGTVAVTQSGTWDEVGINDSGNSITVDNAGTFVTQPAPSTSGGLSIHRSIDLDEGTLEVVKASPGQVYGMWVTNTATATRWIKFYDATSGTAGTGTPVITIGVPGNSSDDIAGNFGPGGMGIAFATGICVGATTGVADADTGAPGANDVIVNIFYK